MRKISMLVTFSLLFGGCGAFKKEIVIPKATIQDMLDKKFPIEKVTLLVRVTMSEPKIYFKNGNIGIIIKYWADALGKEVDGIVDVNTHVRYDNGSFYLSNIEIPMISMNDKEVDQDDKVSKVILSILRNYLETYPVYKLKQTDFKQNLAKLLLKDITVESESLKVLIGL